MEQEHYNNHIGANSNIIMKLRSLSLICTGPSNLQAANFGFSDQFNLSVLCNEYELLKVVGALPKTCRLFFTKLITKCFLFYFATTIMFSEIVSLCPMSNHTPPFSPCTVLWHVKETTFDHSLHLCCDMRHAASNYALVVLMT